MFKIYILVLSNMPMWNLEYQSELLIEDNKNRISMPHDLIYSSP